MRLIDYDAAVDRYYAEWGKMDICDGAQDRDWLKQCIDEAPTIDLKDLQPHGKWESVENPIWPAHSHDKCSVCGWWNTRNALCYDGGHKPGHSLNYCPNCGARMREGIGHEVN